MRRQSLHSPTSLPIPMCVTCMSFEHCHPKYSPLCATSPEISRQPHLSPIFSSRKHFSLDLQSHRFNSVSGSSICRRLATAIPQRSFPPTSSPSSHEPPLAASSPPHPLLLLPLIFLLPSSRPLLSSSVPPPNYSPLIPAYQDPYKVLKRTPHFFLHQIGTRTYSVFVHRLKPATVPPGSQPALPPPRGRPPTHPTVSHTPHPASRKVTFQLPLPSSRPKRSSHPPTRFNDFLL
jgi:hypothetical protein